VLNDGRLGEKKNVNVPGVKINLPVVDEREIHDIVNWAVPHKANYIALSFVQSAEDIIECRRHCGSDMKIIAKIENVEGLRQFDAILKEADGIMVARGDLGMEIPMEKIWIAQKMMIKKTNDAGKIVVTATEMLASMEDKPFPTRAEALDVANAVLDGSSMVMLSGETANGDFCLETVGMMRRRCVRISSFEETSVVLDSAPAVLQSTTEIVGNFAPVDDFEVELEAATRAAGASEEDLRGAKVLPMNPRIREEQQTRQVARLKARRPVLDFAWMGFSVNLLRPWQVLHRHAVDPGEETATRTQPDETQAEDPAEPQLGPKSPCEEELPYLEPFREAVQFPGTVSVTYYSCEDCETEGFCTSDTSFSNYDAACGDARRPEETYAEAARHIFAHTHMTAFEPAMRLDLVSDLDRSMGHEKYHRDAANMLIELLQ
ncbi:PYK, partial [Symbiodinium microadriaticum]